MVSGLKKKLSAALLIVVMTFSGLSMPDGMIASNNTKVYGASIKLYKKKDAEYINRMKFPKYAIDYYHDMLRNSLDAGGYLIDPNNAEIIDNGMYYQTVTTISGSAAATDKDTLVDTIEKKATSSMIPSYCYEAYFAFICDHPEVFWIEQSPKLKYSYQAQ